MQTWKTIKFWRILLCGLIVCCFILEIVLSRNDPPIVRDAAFIGIAAMAVYVALLWRGRCSPKTLSVAPLVIWVAFLFVRFLFVYY